MRRDLVRIVVAIASLVGATAACSDAAGPALVGREYGLETIDGQALPLIVSATTSGDTTWLIGEHVDFESGGRATRTSYYRAVVGSGPGTITQSGSTYAYQVRGAQVSLQPICPANASCIAGFTGTLSDQRLVLSQQYAPEGTVWVYERATIGIADVAR